MDLKMTNNIINSCDQPRKRGRPRKNVIAEKVHKPIEKKKVIKNDEKREIILHLPIHGSKHNISTESEKNAFVPDGDNIDDIEAILTISDQESESDGEKNLHHNELVTELKKRNKTIRQLKEEIQTYKSLIDENVYSVSRNVKLTPMNVSFVNIKNGETIICEKTDVACWWCTYGFEGCPCFIPEKIFDKAFYVFGCFCSFECAAAYNLNLSDYKVSERYSLLKKLYALITGLDSNIQIAPPRETLKKYGGIYTIEEYHKMAKNINVEAKLMLPPMVNLIACIEEKSKDKHLNQNTESELNVISTLSLDDKNIIPTKKKLLHGTNGPNIVDTIGIKEKKSNLFC